LDGQTALDLYDPDFIIRTKSSERPPVKFGSNAKVSRSLISHGCIINGEVRHSVLSPGVIVREGALVSDSIVFDDTILHLNSTVNRCILDKEVVVGEDSYIGYSDDYTANREEQEYLCAGITIVGRRARIPAGVRIGRNCKVNPNVKEDDFVGDFVPSGSTVARQLAVAQQVAS
jgi:glucose-1-phosphate adenylyltransferase